MIKSAKELQGYALHATDGEIGKVDELYFDDDAWAVRYLVVDAGSWLADRRVLISPIAVREVDWEQHRVDISLTRDQVENSPDIDTHKPVSRQNEIAIHQYYAWRYYWGGVGLWGAGMYPSLLTSGAPIPAAAPSASESGEGEKPGEDSQDTYLRSTKEVMGYRIQARDGEIGHVEDFLMDDQTWRIDYMVVDTSNWWFGKKVIIAPTWVKAVDWADQRVSVDLKRETIQNSPEFDPSTLEQSAEAVHRHP